MKKLLSLILACAMCLVLFGCTSGADDKGSAEEPKDTEEQVQEQTPDATEEEPEEQPEEVTEAYSVQLGSGNYTAGVDIPVGTYTVTAVSGNGNVSSSNMFDGGMNEMFGVPDDTGLYTDSFSNLQLEEGVMLSVSGGVVIQLDSNAAKTQSLTPRTPQGAECTLSSGNYTAGVDFEPGVYNITVVSGNGNVSSSNMYEGGLNAIMGIDDGSGLDIYETEYKNIELPADTTLEISGVEIKLTPST